MTKRAPRHVPLGSVQQAKVAFIKALDYAYPIKKASPGRPAATDELRLMSAMAKACIQKSLTPAPTGFKILPTPFQVVHDSILKVQYKTRFAKDNLNDILLQSPFSLAFDTLTRNNVYLVNIHMEFVFPAAPKHLREKLPGVAWPPPADPYQPQVAQPVKTQANPKPPDQATPSKKPDCRAPTHTPGQAKKPAADHNPRALSCSSSDSASIVSWSISLANPYRKTRRAPKLTDTTKTAYSVLPHKTVAPAGPSTEHKHKTSPAIQSATSSPTASHKHTTPEQLDRPLKHTDHAAAFSGADVTPSMSVAARSSAYTDSYCTEQLEDTLWLDYPALSPDPVDSMLQLLPSDLARLIQEHLQDHNHIR